MSKHLDCLRLDTSYSCDVRSCKNRAVYKVFIGPDTYNLYCADCAGHSLKARYIYRRAR